MVLPMEDPELENLAATLVPGNLAARRDAVRQLAGRGGKAVPRLISLLQEPVENEVRWYAAVALVRIGPQVIGPILDAISGNPDPRFRRYAAAALGHLGEPAVAPILKAMRDADPKTRGFLAQALCRIGEPAIPAVRKMLGSDDPVLRECATLTLWQMGGEGLESLLSSMDDGV